MMPGGCGSRMRTMIWWPGISTNAVGLRTRKIIHEGETQVVTVFHYGPAGELQTETDAQGRLLRDYVWANGMVVAQVNVSTGSGGVTREQLVYLYADHLQTPRVGTDVAGRIMWRWEGDAFGATAADTDPDGGCDENCMSSLRRGELQWEP